MKKKLLIFIILFIIAVVGANRAYKAYLNYKFPPCESNNGFEAVKISKSLSNNFVTKYKYVFIKLKADAVPAENPVKYYIVNPNGTILDKGEFDKNNHLKIDKKFPGVKGTWQIKFQSSDPEEIISCNYVLASADSEKAVLDQCRETIKNMK